jgi:hypothetical protein
MTWAQSIVNIGIIGFVAWFGLGLIANPKEWLERHGRSTADNHIRAVRIIGGFAIASVFLMWWQFIRQLVLR